MGKESNTNHTLCTSSTILEFGFRTVKKRVAEASSRESVGSNDIMVPNRHGVKRPQEANPRNFNIIRKGQVHFDLRHEMFAKNRATGSQSRSGGMNFVASDAGDTADNEDDDAPPGFEASAPQSSQSAYNFFPGSSSREPGSSRQSSGKKRSSSSTDSAAITNQVLEKFKDLINEKKVRMDGSSVEAEFEQCIGIVRSYQPDLPMNVVVKAGVAFKESYTRMMFLQFSETERLIWLYQLD